MPTPNRLIFGSERPAVEPLRLRAGPLTMFFEPEAAFLRRVCLGKTEMVRGIYGAVRDRNWGTLRPEITNLSSQILDQSFHLAFDADCREGGIHYRWRGEIIGAANGTVKFTFDGEALTTFLRNRIGLCVLHPLRECRGARARFQRTNSWKVELAFPKPIEPQIPGQASFGDMKSLAYEVDAGLWTELVFDGEVFEMEDQRNWTDASFKTYGTPLARPFPVEVPAGTRIHQSVTLRFSEESPAPAQDSQVAAEPVEAGAGESAISIEVPMQPTLELPRIGLGSASHGSSLSLREASRLAALRLDHLRIDLHLGQGDWPMVLQRAMREAEGLGARMELALHLPAHGGETELADLAKLLAGQSAGLSRVLVFRVGEHVGSSDALQLARRLLGDLGVPIGSGSNANFCELNRSCASGRFGLAEAEFVSWPITPQVHAFDNLSVMETIEAQADTVATARSYADGMPLVVTPVTLRARFNAVATSQDPGEAGDALPPQVDPRQMSLFAAAWTLGTVVALAGADAASITFFETTGWRGIMESPGGSPLPEKFPSIPGAVFPVYFVFAALAGFRRMALMPGADSRSLAAVVLFDDEGRRRLLLANLTPGEVAVSVMPGAAQARVRLLDEANVERAMREPERFLDEEGEPVDGSASPLNLALKPHALASIDLR